MSLDIASYFDYPDETQKEQSQELVFLPQWDNDRWAKLLGYAETRRFHAGDLVIRAGEDDRAFYIIIEGTLEVLIPRRGGRKPQFTRIRADTGAVIGEQAFLDGKPRSATVRAVSAGEMLRVSVDAFEVLAAREPELARDVLFELARTLSVKLRQTTRFISNWLK